MSNDLKDPFVNVWFDDDGNRGHDSSFYSRWNGFSSGKASNTDLLGADALRKLYPKHSVVLTTDSYRLGILNFPAAKVIAMESVPLITNVIFQPLPANISPIPGVLLDQVEFGGFKVSWQEYEYILYMVSTPTGFGGKTRTSYVLHEGPEEPIRYLLLRTGLWAEELHDEVWVFNQGFWRKDAALWRDIQKADWGDVILKEEFKKSFQKDIFGFFSSEELYKSLGIPWKRGLIMYGPPGNGKTISLKAVMKECGLLGFSPLYVKSFQSYAGEEGAMAAVFDKARQLAPCVVVLEDLDSLINDRNRSFFLNQLDGLQGNDGLLILSTTNHFDRLDPGLSTRPSRFDRKYLFDDPDRDERKLYCQYWQEKVGGNPEISFPDALVDEIADSTDRFSFAYLKEAFVSSLVTLAGEESSPKPEFANVLRNQIKVLRKQLNKPSISRLCQPSSQNLVSSGVHQGGLKQDIRPLLDTMLLESGTDSRHRNLVASSPEIGLTLPGAWSSEPSRPRDSVEAMKKMLM